ncbi:hypothetical protein P7_132 [Pectobacterium phage vB_PcaM_P7_Pc]|nr:hypothetical protein P7_132 [Pectobacterium phage vB_PcaM_P7_Pc]
MKLGKNQLGYTTDEGKSYPQYTISMKGKVHLLGQ